MLLGKLKSKLSNLTNFVSWIDIVPTHYFILRMSQFDNDGLSGRFSYFSFKLSQVSPAFPNLVIEWADGKVLVFEPRRNTS